ncbi:MAG: hypothetical protein RIT14_2834 [Pseudomonadota bacterium]|jgi:hypothetical protein
MLRPFLALFLVLLTTAPLRAEGFSRIDDKGEFLTTVAGRELRMGLFGIALQVRPDGVIEGSALGWDVTGRWEWRDGYFCREMDWSGYEIPLNCQLVEARGDEVIRFTVDKGTGEAASFSLR